MTKLPSLDGPAALDNACTTLQHDQSSACHTTNGALKSEFEHTSILGELGDTQGFTHSAAVPSAPAVKSQGCVGWKATSITPR